MADVVAGDSVLATDQTLLRDEIGMDGDASGHTHNGTAGARVDADDLTGTILDSAVVSSSLTSVGTLTALTMGGTLDMANNKLDNVGSALNEFSANKIQLRNANSGAYNSIELRNTSNDASSNAKMTILVGGGTAGDPWLAWSVSSGTSNHDAAMGIDNDNDDIICISKSDTMGTNDAIRCSSATPSVVSFDTTQGGDHDFVCSGCGKHNGEMFLCCGEVKFQDDYALVRNGVFSDPNAIEGLCDTGVLYWDRDDHLWMNITEAISFSWSLSIRVGRYMEERLATVDNVLISIGSWRLGVDQALDKMHQTAERTWDTWESEKEALQAEIDKLKELVEK